MKLTPLLLLFAAALIAICHGDNEPINDGTDQMEIKAPRLAKPSLLTKIFASNSQNNTDMVILVFYFPFLTVIVNLSSPKYQFP